MKALRAIVLAAPLAMLTIGGEPAHAAQPAKDRIAALEAKIARLEAREHQEAANTRLVRSYFDGSMPAELRAAILHPNYIQHSPVFAKYLKVHGLTAVETNAHLMPIASAMFAKARAADPKRPATEQATQIVAQGDLVFMMRTVYEQDPTEPADIYYPYYTWELLRIRDGKFYEHWDYGKIQKDDPFLGVPAPRK